MTGKDLSLTDGVGGQARNCENSIRIQSSAILQSILVFYAMPEMTKPEKETSAFEPIAAPVAFMRRALRSIVSL